MGMKIGYVARWNPLDKNSWSGTYYYTYHELARRHNITILQYKWPYFVREFLLLQKKWEKIVRGKTMAVEFCERYAKCYSALLEKDLVHHKLDLLYAPAAPQLIAHLNTRLPVIFMTDASFQQLQGYYNSYRNLPAWNLHEGITLDKRAFHNAAHCLLASDWAQQSAINDYGVAAAKTSVAPLGANLDNYPAATLAEQWKPGVCKLLFLGVEWERKGGAIALETFRQLRVMGMDARLQIIGCVPPEPVSDEGVEVISFLNKNIPAEQEQLYSHLANAHFLLLPTRAECAGVVFCEASAYGVPSISADTGGVATYVRNGKNGYTLPLTSGGKEYAAKIFDIFHHAEAYHQLRLSSRTLFETALCWEAWGRKFENAAGLLC
jgi:glycosyltransferase involved in cell wall biosynthesis